jgi:antitoxin CcdA
MAQRFRKTETESTTNLVVDDGLLRDAGELHIDVRKAAEAGIVRAIEAERRALGWARDNADVVASTNAYIEKHGLPLQKYRIR